MAFTTTKTSDVNTAIKVTGGATAVNVIDGIYNVKDK